MGKELQVRLQGDAGRVRGNGHRTPARDSGKACKCKQVMFITVLKEGHTVAERDDIGEDSFWMRGLLWFKHRGREG